MADPVSRIIFHHEGAGAPTDKVDRPLHERYSISIGITTYKMANPPSRSFITDGTRGRSLQIVFTGNRDKFALTDSDIRLVERAVADAKRLDWVTALPKVQLHGDTANTGCPGMNVELRRADLERACGLLVTTTPPAQAWPIEWSNDVPKPTDIVDVLDMGAECWQLTADGGVRTVKGPFHGAYPMIPNQPPRLFYAITPNQGRPGYTEWATDGAFYSGPTVPSRYDP